MAVVLSLLLTSPAAADSIRVAVASNFADAMKQIVSQFEAVSEHRVSLIPGSTGKHFAQIYHGAPFDLFFAADAKRPMLLEQQGASVADSRFTYAIGKLVLWSAKADYVDADAKVLEQSSYRFLALANPKLAPYGMAAQQVLQQRGLWKARQRRIVRGENIAQTYQFVKSGNAQLGFVAYSQLKRPDNAAEGSYWLVPQSLYTPIVQQAVLLKDSPAAREFWNFVQQDDSLETIRRYGYDTP